MPLSEFDLPPLDTFTVVTWNILLDHTRTKAGTVQSQADRVPSLVASLADLRAELGTELDVVGIQEAHNACGKLIAEALGYGSGHWVEHNKKPYPGSKTGRPGEHVGLFGALVEYVEPVELGDNRRAALSHVGETALVTIHPRAGIHNGPLQQQQVEVVLDKTQGYKSVAFFGDFNSRLRGIARQSIEAEGFESVFPLTGQEHPKTWPTPDYHKVMIRSATRPKLWQRPKNFFLPYFVPAVVFDDIYIRGLGVSSAGSFVGDSDHAGLWAKLYTLN